ALLPFLPPPLPPPSTLFPYTTLFRSTVRHCGLIGRCVRRHGEVPGRSIVQGLCAVAGVDDHHQLVVGWVQVGKAIGAVIQQTEGDQAWDLIWPGVEKGQAMFDVISGFKPEQSAVFTYPE